MEKRCKVALVNWWCIKKEATGLKYRASQQLDS